ncbi:MAG: hypothetical protein QG641_1851 [Candidatus Poribacteria bacterium]|nr:hypothetical protein [Candidatus Poribacteria bacterium]
MPRYIVTFYPKKIQINNNFNIYGRATSIAKEGDNLLEIAKPANVFLNNTCGGEGICGKCKVIIRKGDYQTKDTPFISQRERELGYVLACHTTVHSDLEVEILPESRLEDEQFLTGDKETLLDKFDTKDTGLPFWQTFNLHPFISPFPSMTTKIHLQLPLPTLQDNVDDKERLLREIRRGKQVPIIQMDLTNLKNLGRFLRKNDWDVTVLLGNREGIIELIQIEAGDTSKQNYGIAVDIGTTTIVAHLVDLTTRKTLGIEAVSNSQSNFGADVISRIIYASGKKGLDELHKSVVDDINRLIILLIQANKLNINDVTCVMCSGNATMTHFLLGIEPTYIRREPYVPTANFYPVIKADEVDILINQRGLLGCIPGVSSYVGGDITAGVLASGMSESESNCLLIDIGTNGEMVLGNKDWLVCCSCSCGPAFEGSGIKYGMRAGRGAIQRITIDDIDYEINYSTIGDDKPRGICGSGLIDALGEMLRVGIIDKTGRIQSDLDSPRYQEGEDGAEFILAWKEETASGYSDIVITQSDIDNLIRSKAALYAALVVMMQKMGMTWDDIERIYIGGAFGNYLNIEKSVFIGLIPDLPIEKYQFIGNSSITGTKMTLLSNIALAKAEEIAKKMTYIELSADNTFMEQFTAAIFLPHTDMDLFPSVANKKSVYVNNTSFSLTK